MISAGYSKTLAQAHAALLIPTAASRTFPSQLRVLLPTLILNLPLLLLLLLSLRLRLHHQHQHQRHLLHPLLSTILSTYMETSAMTTKIVLFVAKTAITVINHIPSKTPRSGTLLMPPADAFPTSALLKATHTLRLSMPIIKMVSVMAVATAA
jgi:hypothetical protein